MSTIHDLRARQRGLTPSRISGADASKPESGITSHGTQKQSGAEIILFPRASVRAEKRPRSKQTRRNALKA
ncbi:MAG: hypothetical protein KTR19_02115 [Hyphomicrobiales bacterium]|nr:hypothetical protein [Hyphomicrobiales bacterium]